MNDLISDLLQMKEDRCVSEDDFTRMRDLLVCGDLLIENVIKNYKKQNLTPLNGISRFLNVIIRITIIRLPQQEI